MVGSGYACGVGVVMGGSDAGGVGVVMGSGHYRLRALRTPSSIRT